MPPRGTWEKSSLKQDKLENLAVTTEAASFIRVAIPEDLEERLIFDYSLGMVVLYVALLSLVD